MGMHLQMHDTVLRKPPYRHRKQAAQCSRRVFRYNMCDLKEISFLKKPELATARRGGKISESSYGQPKTRETEATYRDRNCRRIERERGS